MLNCLCTFGVIHIDMGFGCWFSLFIVPVDLCSYTVIKLVDYDISTLVYLNPPPYLRLGALWHWVMLVFIPHCSVFSPLLMFRGLCCALVRLYALEKV